MRCFDIVILLCGGWVFFITYILTTFTKQVCSDNIVSGPSYTDDERATICHIGNPFQNGAYLWGVRGACDYLGGNCTYVADTLTTCKNLINCGHLIKTLSHVPGVDAVVIQPVYNVIIKTLHVE
jgi:hypothetical protein